jgi:protein tyrosine phosphatase
MHSTRPFLRSYWAIPEQLIAGCYPGDLNAASMEEKLGGLVDANVSMMVSLMEEHETDHRGRPFVDYGGQLLELAQIRGRQIHCVRFPIRDMSIPTGMQMRTILDAIKNEIACGGRVYVHCWGGKGRTATVIGCLLLEMGLEDTETVLPRIKELTAHASEFFWPTPQTEEQCDFVRHWNG